MRKTTEKSVVFLMQETDRYIITVVNELPETLALYLYKLLIVMRSLYAFYKIVARQCFYPLTRLIFAPRFINRSSMY